MKNYFRFVNIAANLFVDITNLKILNDYNVSKPRMVEAARRATRLLKVLRTIPSTVHEPAASGKCAVRNPPGGRTVSMMR